MQNLARLYMKGFALSIDDYGTGIPACNNLPALHLVS